MNCYIYTVVKFIRENREFTVIFMLAALIRFIPAFNYQFSYDELCGLRNSVYTNWHDMVNYGVKLDTHPILVQLIINCTVKLFGYSEFWVKLPFLLFSLAAILYGYLFSLKWYGKTPALITASVFSFSYIFLFYAPLARMYAGGLFFSTALVYYLFEICFDPGKKTKHYILFVLFILLCALNNHLSCLFAFTCAGFGLFFQTRNSIVKYLVACMSSLILYLPHLGITMAQLGQGGIGHEQDGWLAAPLWWALFGFFKTLLGTGYIWTLFALTFLIAFALLKEMPFNKKTVLLLVLFFFNYLVIYLYSVYKAPVFQYSVMLFSAPCFIWAATSIIKFSRRSSVFITIILSGALIYQSLIVKHFFTNAVLNQNGFQSKALVKIGNSYGKGTIESYFMGSQRFFVILYELKYHRRFNYFIGEDFKGPGAFKKQLAGSGAIYILLGEPTETQLAIAREYFPYVLEHKQTLNVNCYLLSKDTSDLKTGVDLEKIADVSSVEAPGKWDYNFDRGKMNNRIYAPDSLNEFCFSAKAPIKKLFLGEGNILLARVKIKSKEPLKDVGFNYNVSNEKDSTLFFGGTDIDGFFSDSTGYYAYSELFVGSEMRKWWMQNAKITFFIWNRGKRKFSLSDFEIQTIDYWPERWKWWK